MQLRVYLLIRILRYYSKWNNDIAKYIWYPRFVLNNHISLISKQQFSETGNAFVIKVYLKIWPYSSLTFFMGIAIFIFGFALRESEMYFYNKLFFIIILI